MPRWSLMFSRTPCTIPTTPRLPRIYRGVRGLPLGFSDATTTASPILNLLFIDFKILLNRAALAAFRVPCGRSRADPSAKHGARHSPLHCSDGDHFGNFAIHRLAEPKARRLYFMERYPIAVDHVMGGQAKSAFHPFRTNFLLVAFHP